MFGSGAESGSPGSAAPGHSPAAHRAVDAPSGLRRPRRRPCSVTARRCNGPRSQCTGQVVTPACSAQRAHVFKLCTNNCNASGHRRIHRATCPPRLPCETRRPLEYHFPALFPLLRKLVSAPQRFDLAPHRPKVAPLWSKMHLSVRVLSGLSGKVWTCICPSVQRLLKVFGWSLDRDFFHGICRRKTLLDICRKMPPDYYRRL